MYLGEARLYHERIREFTEETVMEDSENEIIIIKKLNGQLLAILRPRNRRSN